jgi:alpha-galactosidase
MKNLNTIIEAATVAFATVSGLTGAAEPIQPPPNAPTTVEWNARASRLSLRYHGAVILDATVHAEAGNAVAEAEVKLDPAETTGEKVEQRLRFTLAKPQDGVKLVLRGTATASDEAFPAETSGPAQKRFPLVRNSVGLSRNLRNNALYDRRWDWLLAGPDDGATRILLKATGHQDITYAWESRGPAIELVFRPRFYQKHRNLAKFKPWTYPVWKGPVTGYCTWWAYKYDFTQKTLHELVEVFTQKKLPDFGYKYIQLDDTYQIGNGSCPTNRLTWNKKFPGGAGYALQKIQSARMEGGIWVHRVHRPSDPHVVDIGKQHPDWFVQKTNGTLFTDGGFYVLNTKNKEALDGMVRPIYRELKKQGWGYVKIDGAGDLLNAYKSKNCADHFQRIGSTPEESLRDWDRVAREELGTNIYILSCWGVGPGVNVIGLVDGCRLSDDGFQPETLANRSAYEGVVWRNDPDHCDILGSWLMDQNATMPVFGLGAPVSVRSIVRPAICSIAGGVLMVSDKVEVYQDDQNIEGMKRSAPVLSTVPGQLYDAGHNVATWWLQEIDRPFDHWSVLARIQWAKKREKEWKFDLKGSPAQEVKFADLGLEADCEYLVFEFWRQKFLGQFQGSFTAPPMDTNNGMAVFAIREARAHSWVISTTRHISQGGVDLQDERWDARSQTLSGRSAVISGDPYVLTVHLPDGLKLKSAQVGGEKLEIANQKEAATLRAVPSATKTVEWKMTFAK